MLQRFVELKDEIKCAISNLDSPSRLAIMNYEWDVCESLIMVLESCEEVTREMSGQKYVSGCSVLPITVGLTSALNEIADPAYQQNSNLKVFADKVEMCRQELLSEITSRLANMENSKTFTTSVFLDPRYKLYLKIKQLPTTQKTRHSVGDCDDKRTQRGLTIYVTTGRNGSHQKTE
ncbi:unnamed protein product [Parnassius apollo]|uniref:(apollo) hypothetical protein n=1 Tax=Parnassius apollo TaxID=110799 RepID=A0A8S3WUK6_PARAO|nr:unnamed protein product [Parnassius apollo]